MTGGNDQIRCGARTWWTEQSDETANNCDVRTGTLDHLLLRRDEADVATSLGTAETTTSHRRSVEGQTGVWRWTCVPNTWASRKSGGELLASPADVICIEWPINEDDMAAEFNFANAQA